MHLDRRILSILGIPLALVAFLAFNVFSGIALRGPALDLTENRQFTLSDGTRTMLADIQEPVRLRFYLSSSLRETNPYLWSYAQQARDMLESFREASGGRVEVQVIDPQPFSEEEDRAVGAGLQPILGPDQSTAFLGIAGANTTDDTDVIAMLSPERERFLEYDLTRLVYDLSRPTKPVLGIITGLPLEGSMQDSQVPWQILSQLRQFYDVRMLSGEEYQIDPAIQVLMLVQPDDLPEQNLYAIDQFVMRGGHLLAFTDPFSEAAQAIAQVPGDFAAKIDGLLASWGVELVPDRIAGDPDAARQVAIPQEGGRQQVLPYLPWLSLDGSHVDPGEPAVANLDVINLMSPGVLRPVEGATTSFTPLIQTGPEAGLLDAAPIRTYPDPIAVLRAFQPGSEPLTLAARLTGPAKSAYPTPPASDDPAAPPASAHLAEAQAPLNVVVVADADLLEDQAWLAAQPGGQGQPLPIASNADMVLNLLDTLAGSDALLSLRGRDITLRPFTRIQELQRTAEAEYRVKEEELTASLEEVQAKLQDLGGIGEDQQGMVLTEAQRQEVQGFRARMLDLRAELRAVQLALNQEIDRLEGRLTLINILAVPLAVAVIAVLVALWRRMRTRKRFRPAQG
ncbi:Gldg family protein [Geminicoccus harenae]|uniref:Gldg family protein n=1 Tax=Geminicoccus harenae TaxID=2498453 RepID=UPI00168A6167|nr:Gldg family protein [Geminicoccus harenae]